MLTQDDIDRLIVSMKQILVTKEDLKKSLRLIEKKLDVAISYFDRTTTNQDKRVKRVENHLHLPPFAD